MVRYVRVGCSACRSGLYYALRCASPGPKSNQVSPRAGTIPCMMSIELTKEELALVRHALSSFLLDFGHKEKDVVHSLQQLLGKIPQPE